MKVCKVMLGLIWRLPGIFNAEICLLHLEILLLISNLCMGSRGSAQAVELDTDGAKK